MLLGIIGDYFWKILGFTHQKHHNKHHFICSYLFSFPIVSLFIFILEYLRVMMPEKCCIGRERLYIFSSIRFVHVISMILVLIGLC